jgi:hypothetical protein
MTLDRNITTSLTDEERDFIAHYVYELFHGMRGPVSSWLGERKMTVMDFSNLIVLYQAEGAAWDAKPESGPLIPWETAEDLRERNRKLENEVAQLRGHRD